MHRSHKEGRRKDATRYSELAARRAMDVSAYGEAARLLEQALEVQEVLDPADRTRRCDLLITFGQALWPAGEPRRVLDDVAPAALALAEELGDRPRTSSVCQLALRAILVFAGSPGFATEEGAHWVEEANRLAEEGSAVASSRTSPRRLAASTWAARSCAEGEKRRFARGISPCASAIRSCEERPTRAGCSRPPCTFRPPRSSPSNVSSWPTSSPPAQMR